MKNFFKKQKINKLYDGRHFQDFRQLIDFSVRDFSSSMAFTVKDSNKNLHDVSYADFAYDVKALGTALIDLAIGNKKIAVISAARYEWCTSYLSITTSGYIAVPLDHLLPMAELKNLIVESEIEAIIFDIKYMDLMKELMASGISHLKYFICMDLSQDTDEFISYPRLLEKGKQLLDSHDTRYDDMKIDKDALSILLYTSGTTSKPKAVMLSQYNICSNICAISTIIKRVEDDSILVFLPLHHTLACTASFLFCVGTGFRICFADSIKDVGKNMKEYAVSGLVCVPALLDIMYRQIIRGVKKSKKYVMFRILCVISNFLRFFNIDLRRVFFKEILDNLGGNLRIIIYGSASSDKEKIKLLNTIGIDMLQGYGLTETSPVISCQSDKNHNVIGSTGLALHNVEVKIDSPNEEGDGEILAKGPNIMLGYYNNEAATKEVIKDGWFYTGDLGHLDKHGNLFITGRKKDVIVLSNGKNVYPQEIEALINDSPYVLESFIYEKNDKICAKIVYSDDILSSENITKQQLYEKISEEIKGINKDLPVYKYIREFTLSNIPLEKTTTQKIKRNEEMKKI